MNRVRNFSISKFFLADQGRKISFNAWDLAEKFQEMNPSLTFCTTYNCFYFYDENLIYNQVPLWVALKPLDLQADFISWLKDEYKDDYRAFDIGRLNSQIIPLLKNQKFSMPEEQTLAYKDGFLLPFINGVLNCATLQFLPHAKENMSRHFIPVNYESHKGKNLNNTYIGQFLKDISNHKTDNLNVIRAILKIILTNDLKYQVGLYIHGPGGTGKTTFTNLLQFILGPGATVSSSLSSLNSRFGAAKLKDKLLLLINELPLITSGESSILKAIIGEELIGIEEKYLAPTQIIPKVFIVISSNSVWDIKNTSSGFTRRWIYLPFNFKPFDGSKKMDLLNFNSNYEASGIIVPELSQFIAWVISCPKEYIRILSKGGEYVTHHLSPDSLIKTNPLKAWVDDCLVKDDYGKIPIGGRGSDKTTLYGSFINWCSKFDLEVGRVKSNQFSPLLIDLLKSLNWPVEKKRTSSGFQITGIKFNTEYGKGIDRSGDLSHKIDVNYDLNIY